MISRQGPGSVAISDYHFCPMTMKPVETGLTLGFSVTSIVLRPISNKAI